MPKTIEQPRVTESTTITFTNDEWCRIHIAVLNRRSDLFRTKEYELGDTMNPLAEKIVRETRNFYGVE